jgi:hypothetical protein
MLGIGITNEEYRAGRRRKKMEARYETCSNLF